MAHGYHFSKVRLDTPTAPKRISSTFSALRRREDDHGLYHSAEHANSAPHLATPSALTDDDLVLSHPPLDEDLSNKLRNGDDLDSSSRSEVSDVAASSPASEVSSVEASMRFRRTSISFAHEVTLDTGDKRLLDGPLLRSAPRDVPSPAHHAATLQSWERAENGEVGENLETESILEQLLLDRRKDQDEPLEADHETPASLTSAATASPVAHEISTPGNEMIPSPTAKTALPIAFPPQRTSAAWSTRRSEGAHSRSYNRLNSLAGSGAASAGRRRATRSATSSMSPASAFLSNFGRLAVEEVTEPDDEGQEIGDHSGWIIGRKIGYGGFSVVKEVSTMENGKRVVRAVKIVRKQPQTIRDDTQNEHIQAEFEHEVSIWRFLKHQYILPLISVYDTPFAMFCITKLNVGGTLHDLLRSRSQQYPRAERGLSASVAKRYTYQLAAAVRYLHEDVRVVHRDIKLENCLLDMSAPDAKAEGGNVLLCDFGMADFIHNETRVDPEPADSRARQTTNRNIGPSDTSSHLSSHSGTTMPDASLDNRDATLSVMGSLEYAAPELISASSTLFSPAADIWAFGVVIYALLTGSLPFSHAMKEKLVVVIEKTQWDVGPLYQCPAVKGGGPAGLAAVDLVKGCLTHDPEDRWDIEQVLNCRWLMGCREYYGDGIVTEEGPGWR